VSLSWSASTGATSYNIYRGTVSGNESAAAIQTGISNSPYADTTVTNGQIYYYTVKAVNANGTSPASNEASATPTSGSANADIPYAPTAPAMDGAVDAVWSAAPAYDIERWLPDLPQRTPAPGRPSGTPRTFTFW
jgi:fibronectin type 3 domain-containing protein